MVVSFENSAHQALFVTPLLQYGVDGYSMPSWLGATPSPRDAAASFQVDPSIYYQTEGISIFLFHAPKNRLGAIFSKTFPILLEIVEWIVALFGSSSKSNVYASSSAALTADTSTQIVNGATYAIHVPTGQFVTAVNGGGVGEPANRLPLHTDATALGPWEKFEFLHLFGDVYAIQTSDGHYLTAVNGGGMGEPANHLPLHTDATALGPWEKFTLMITPDGCVAIRTANGRFVTAVNGGGMGEPANRLPLHTDATALGPWEKFTLTRL